MTPPVQPESELQRIEHNISAWFAHILEVLKIHHAATGAPIPLLPAPPSSTTPEPTGLNSNNPNEPVELTPQVALALGSVGVQNTHYISWLTALSHEALAAWILSVLTAGAVTDLTASHAIMVYAGTEYHVTNECQAVLITLQNVGAISGIS